MTRSQRPRLPRSGARSTARPAAVPVALLALGAALLGAALLGAAPVSAAPPTGRPPTGAPVLVSFVTSTVAAPAPAPPIPALPMPQTPPLPAPPNASPGAGPPAAAPLAANPPGANPSGAYPSGAIPSGADPAGADSTSADSVSTDPASPATTALSRGPARQLRIFLTGYSFHDNTPPLSAIVSHPILHKAAGGQGTYRDPITVAVPGGPTTMKWKPGTRFYLPSVRRYVIVEDSGASPAPDGVDTHLDMWIGGQGGTRFATDDCMSRLTGRVPAILNPRPGLPVLRGPIFANRACHLPALGAAQDPVPGPALGPALGRATTGPRARPPAGPRARPPVRPHARPHARPRILPKPRARR
jgi:hypothetical protein